MKVITNTKDLPREEWLKYRKLGLGGSDVGIITGMNKYKSPFTLYLEKLDELPNDDQESEPAYWGNTLEEIVAQEFSKRTGLEVQERHELLQHDEHTFMIANLDREVTCPDRGIGILECKTASEYLKDEWSDDKIPSSYYLQVQHYLAVTGYSFAYIAVLIGGNKFIHKEVERDEEVISYLIQLESNFWNEHVLKRVPPALDDTDSTKDSIHYLYSDTSGIGQDLTPDCLEWIEQLKTVKSKIKDLEQEKQFYENQIKFHLGENEIGTYDGEVFVTWKPTKKGNRVLKIKEVS